MNENCDHKKVINIDGDEPNHGALLGSTGYMPKGGEEIEGWCTECGSIMLRDGGWKHPSNLRTELSNEENHVHHLPGNNPTHRVIDAQMAIPVPCPVCGGTTGIVYLDTPPRGLENGRVDVELRCHKEHETKLRGLVFEMVDKLEVRE